MAAFPAIDSLTCILAWFVRQDLRWVYYRNDVQVTVVALDTQKPPMGLPGFRTYREIMFLSGPWSMCGAFLPMCNITVLSKSGPAAR